MVRTFALLTLAFTVVAASATAQEAQPDTLEARTIPSRLGGVFQAVGFGPAGAFRDNASFSFGGMIGGRYFLDSGRFVALYAGVGFADYGSEEADLFLFDGRTYTQMIFLEVGPQIHIGRGPIVPYIHGTVGITNIATRTSVTFLGETLDTDTDISDTNLALAGGGGLRIRAGSIHLDFAVTYQRNGTMTYLAEDEEFTSKADVLRFQVGVSTR